MNAYITTKHTVSLSKKLYHNCLVLVGPKNGFERDLHKQNCLFHNKVVWTKLTWSVCLSVSVSLSLCFSVSLSLCLSVSLSLCLSVSLSLCLSLVSRLMLYTNITFVYTCCTGFETDALYECHFCLYVLYMFRDWCSIRMSLSFIRTAQVSRLMLYKNVTPCFKKSSATLSVILLQMQIRVGMGTKSGMLAQTTPLWHLITASVRISLHTQVLRYSLQRLTYFFRQFSESQDTGV